MRMPSVLLNNIFTDISLRCAVGVIFLVAGVAKLPMHTEWVEFMLAYKVLPGSLANFYYSALPWLEITIGACLILGLFTRFFSLVSIPVIASFIVGNAIALSYDMSAHSLYGECFSCFGEVITMTPKEALVIDALLLVGVLLIFFQRRRFMALDSRLARLSRFKR